MNKFEKFALAMSVLLYEMRGEDINNSMLFDDDGEQIPVDFIDKALDSDIYAEQMKSLLRMSVLKDVTEFPDKYMQKHMGQGDSATSEYVYSSNVYDHAYLVDEYICALYADTQTKIVSICSHCNSDNVQIKAWVRPNQGNQYVDAVPDDCDMGWCDDCGLSSDIQIAELKRRAVVEGFQVIGDEGTKEAGKFHPHMNNNSALYSLDQANSMMDDSNDGSEQWQLLTVWTGDVENAVIMFEDGDPRDQKSDF